MSAETQHEGPIDMGEIERRLGLKIESLASDSRRVGKGDIFLAYPGATADGREHIGEALDGEAVLADELRP